MKAIGARIKSYRIALNQTRHQVAEIIGVSEGTLGAIESGENVTFQFIVILAEYYGMTAALLIDLDKPVPNGLQLREHMSVYHTRRNKKIIDLLNIPPELTWSLNDLIAKDFFITGKRVKDVAEKLKEFYQAEYSRSAISNVLIKFVQEQKLSRTLEGAKNYLYHTRDDS